MSGVVSEKMYYPGQPISKITAKGKKKAAKPAYFLQSVNIVMSFGLTELKAHMTWKRGVRPSTLFRFNMFLPMSLRQNAEQR